MREDFPHSSVIRQFSMTQRDLWRENCEFSKILGANQSLSFIAWEQWVHLVIPRQILLLSGKNSRRPNRLVRLHISTSLPLLIANHHYPNAWVGFIKLMRIFPVVPIIFFCFSTNLAIIISISRGKFLLVDVEVLQRSAGEIGEKLIECFFVSSSVPLILSMFN